MSRGRYRLALAGLLLLSGTLLLPYRDYLTDDTFIHLQFAKHVALGRGFAFNAGEPTYGATSPLWVGLLATAGRLGVPVTAPDDADSMPPLAEVAKGLGAAFALLSVWLLARLAGRLGLPSAAALMAGAMLALHAWAGRWALSGMETPLATVCVLASLLLLLPVLDGGGRPVALGLALGLGPLVRPELHFFAALAVVTVWWGAGARGFRSALAAVAGYALATVPWMAAAWTWFHRVLPNTAAAKAGAWLDVPRGLDAIAAAVRATLAVEAVPLALVAAAVAAGAGFRAAPRGRRAFVALLLAWPVLLSLALAAAGTQVVSRYLQPATPCILLLAALSLPVLANRLLSGRIGAAAVAACTLFAAPNLYITARIAAPSAAEHTRGLRGSLVVIGLWARERTDPAADFAVPDIGAFGYYSDRRVLDLYGLVTPELAPLVIREGYDGVVEGALFESAGRPRYLIDRAMEEGRLARPGGEPGPYRLLFSRFIGNLGITRPGRYVYSVYEIDWQAYDALHPRTAANASLDRGARVVYDDGHGRAGPYPGHGNESHRSNLPSKARVPS